MSLTLQCASPTKTMNNYSFTILTFVCIAQNLSRDWGDQLVKMSFRYTEAIVCRLPDDLSSKVDLRKCRVEFEEYITVLRDTGVVSIQLSLRPTPDLTEAVTVISKFTISLFHVQGRDWATPTWASEPIPLRRRYLLYNQWNGYNVESKTIWTRGKSYTVTRIGTKVPGNIITKNVYKKSPIPLDWNVVLSDFSRIHA